MKSTAKLRQPRSADVTEWLRAVDYHSAWFSGTLGYTLAGGALSDMRKRYSHAMKMLAKHGLTERGTPRRRR